MKKIISLLLLTFLFGFKYPPGTKNRRLVVLISVDQMRGDYLKRFEASMPFTTKMVRKNGVNFTNTHHFHSKTTTAAGHATIATGCFPRTHGIVDNDVYIRAKGITEYSILDTSITFVGIDSCKLQKVSAAKLLRPTIGDFIKEKDARSKCYSVALKDRAAILMGGHKANRAFWFDEASTQMVSSSYYTEKFPDWISDYKAATILKNEMELGWHIDPKTIPNNQSKYLDKDSALYECGSFAPWFPHTLQSFDKSRVKKNEPGAFMWNTPYGDAFALNFAKKLIVEEELGTDNHTDLLTIGLSAADVIGHQFGPNSLEIADYYLKLDGYIEEFVKMLDKQVGKNNYTIILTSDHGVVPMPEYAAKVGEAKRIEKTHYKEDITAIDQKLKAIFKLTLSTLKEYSDEGVEPDFKYLTSNNIDTARFLKLLKVELEKLPYISHAYTPSDFVGSQNNEGYKMQINNSYDARFGYFVQIVPKENYLVNMRSCGTTHGTPYTYDTHVPFIILNSGYKSKIINKTTWTVDIAPTILSLLGIDVSMQVDGKNVLTKKGQK